MSENGRLLEDLIGDLASGVFAFVPSPESRDRQGGLRPVSLALDLPVETRVTAEGDAVVVRADVPQTRTRTSFDRPLGRLALHLIAETRS